MPLGEDFAASNGSHAVHTVVDILLAVYERLGAYPKSLYRVPCLHKMMEENKRRFPSVAGSGPVEGCEPQRRRVGQPRHVG